MEQTHTDTLTTSEIIKHVNDLGEFSPITKLKVSRILRTRKVEHVGTRKIPTRAASRNRGGAVWEFAYPRRALDVVLTYLRARAALALPK